MWRNITEDLIVHLKRCDDFKSCSLSVYSLELKWGKYKVNNIVVSLG